MTTNYVGELTLSYDRKTEAGAAWTLNSSEAVAEYARTQMYGRGQIGYREHVYAILVGQNLSVKGHVHLSAGGITHTVVDVRVLMQHVLLSNSTRLILVHNHPSGNRMPSVPDNKLTEKVRECCKLFDVELSDHVILTEDTHFSYRDENIL